MTVSGKKEYCTEKTFIDREKMKCTDWKVKKCIKKCMLKTDKNDLLNWNYGNWKIEKLNEQEMVSGVIC